MSLERQIDRVVADFVHDLRKLVQEATKEEVRRAIDQALTAGKRGGARRAALLADGGGRGKKRSAKQMAVQQQRLYDYIKSHPGERMELIVKGVGISTNLLQPLIKRLLADKKIKAKGKARGTTYTVS